MKKFILIMIVYTLFLVSQLRSEDQNITIVVTDSTFKPIKNAYVEIITPFYRGSDYNGKTDDKGIITFGIPYGKYDIVIRHARLNGYSSEIIVKDTCRIFNYTLNSCTDYYEIEGQIDFKPKLSYNPFEKKSLGGPTMWFSQELLEYTIDSTGYYHVIVPIGILEFEFWHACNTVVVKFLMPPQKGQHIVNITFDSRKTPSNYINSPYPSLFNSDPILDAIESNHSQLNNLGKLFLKF